MINLKINKMDLIDKVIADNRKSVVRELVKKGKINDIITLEYCNYADDLEMLEILSSKTSCIEFMRTIKLNKTWFDFVFDKYCRIELDVDILDVMVEYQPYGFDIEQFDLISDKTPAFKERLMSLNIIKKLNPHLLGALNDRKQVPESVIYDLTDDIAQAVCLGKKFEPGVRIPMLQVIMTMRKITEDECNFYVNTIKEKDEFTYIGGLGVLLTSQEVKEDIVVEALRVGKIKMLPKNRADVDKVERWVLGILKKQNLDNILDLVLDKIENNEYLIEEILEHNKATSTKTLLKLATKYKNIAYNFNNTGYPILESHKF